MEVLAKEIPGFVGQESSRENSGFGLAVSYWKDLDSIQHWKNNLKHQAAKSKGITKWYRSHKIRITKVEEERP